MTLTNILRTDAHMYRPLRATRSWPAPGRMRAPRLKGVNRRRTGAVIEQLKAAAQGVVLGRGLLRG